MDRLSWLDKLENGKAEDAARNVDRRRLRLEHCGNACQYCHMPHGDNIGRMDPSGHGGAPQPSIVVQSLRRQTLLVYWLLAISH
jgi:hypothetical protein